MIPRTQVIVADVSADRGTGAGGCPSSPLSAYKDRIDNVVGVLHVEGSDDAERHADGWPAITPAELMRTPVMYVPSRRLPAC